MPFGEALEPSHVGIDTGGWHGVILEGQSSFRLKLSELLRIDVSTERASIRAPFPLRSAALIERNSAGFGVGLFGHRTDIL